MSKTPFKEDLKSIQTALLPPQIKLFVAIIGLSETIRLLNAKGGHKLELPVIAERAITLQKSISYESVLKLCNSRLAGKRITLPKADKILLQFRNQDILGRKNSTTKAQLATEYDLTQRQIQNIWNTPAGQSGINQTELF